MDEIDHIAERYKWTQDYILSLSIKHRKWYVSRISEKNQKENDAMSK